MGARALYLGETVYRIHGTNQPQTIGYAISSGCFLTSFANDDVADLYERVPVGTKVIVKHAANQGSPTLVVEVVPMMFQVNKLANAFSAILGVGILTFCCHAGRCERADAENRQGPRRAGLRCQPKD